MRAEAPTNTLAATLGRVWAGVWERTPAPVRRSPDLAAVIAMAVAGLGISIYLTTVHYAHVALACPTGTVVNCAKALSSAYSVVPGTAIPITIPGMAWFLVSGGLAAWSLVLFERGEREPARLRQALFGWGALGLAFVLYLVYAELVKLHTICEWCTVVHLLTLATFLVALNRLQRPQARLATSAAGRASTRRPSVGVRPAPRSASALRSAEPRVGRSQRKARRR